MLGKRCLEELVVAAAVDVDAFYRTQTPVPCSRQMPLVVQVDGKGVVMRPEALREATRRAAEKAASGHRGRLAPGEKPNRKRMATVARVAVPYLEIVRTAGASPVPNVFARATVAPGAAVGGADALLAIRGWLPDRARIAAVAAAAAPRVRFGEVVPPSVARAEENREIDKSDRYITFSFNVAGHSTC